MPDSRQVAKQSIEDLRDFIEYRTLHTCGWPTHQLNKLADSPVINLIVDARSLR